jgi:hypothetical protein
MMEKFCFVIDEPSATVSAHLEDGTLFASIRSREDTYVIEVYSNMCCFHSSSFLPLPSFSVCAQKRLQTMTMDELRTPEVMDDDVVDIGWIYAYSI